MAYYAGVDICFLCLSSVYIFFLINIPLICYVVLVELTLPAAPRVSLSLRLDQSEYHIPHL